MTYPYNWGQKLIGEEDIGIISPYNAQCGKIAELLRDNPGIKIGNVEQFQGQVRLRFHR